MSRPAAARMVQPDKRSLRVAVVAAGPSRSRLEAALRAPEIASVTHAKGAEHASVRRADVVIVIAAAFDDAHDAVQEAAKEDGPAVVVVLPEGGHLREFRRLLAAGADGLVLTSALETALLPTVQAVCEGQIVAPRELWRSLERPLLSRREKQILAMVVLGLANREIAQTLFVTEATVKSHLSSAFAKLGVRSRAQATARILDPADGLGTGILAITDDRERESR